ncbi:MAG: hypothetical protein L0Y79_03340 [Chlorobi bacterium]|nr:hypothetical protein [Chlorobiota bacterium]MCI0715928.1 hypothetical protein [Chlorobiota bacterium]
MTFKKDYINYLLYTVVNSGGSEFMDNLRLRKLVNRIIATDEIVELTYRIGKTAGLDALFKYMLYISDKIDKSQVTIFNVKDNFEYDIKNLSKICTEIAKFKSQSVSEAIDSIAEETIEQTDEGETQEISKDTIKIGVEEEANLSNITSVQELEEITEESEDSKLSIIENPETLDKDTEVFELESITDSVENTESVSEEDAEKDFAGEEKIPEDNPEEEIEAVRETKPEDLTAGREMEIEEEEIEPVADKTLDSKEAEIVKEELPEIEIEVKKSESADSFSAEKDVIKEETVTNEAYNKFENKFFEEVKILEKLFAYIDKDCRKGEGGMKSEKCLKSISEIIEITSELGNLSRQLSFDLIADIFLTMNLYFTKAINSPVILISERIRLLDSSLAMVNSLIKGEDYLNYDTIVDRMEKLKSEVMGTPEEEYIKEVEVSVKSGPDMEEPVQEQGKKQAEPAHEAEITETDVSTVMQDSSVLFKLKYLVKEFEKTFLEINELKGEYKKFEAIEKINDLNNTLRMIARIAFSVKIMDLIKLSEVTYVFLKYVKDYRMDLLDSEIQQIIKYIIFTFKMILTGKKPDDFNVLVQYLNNPVKIFTDS